MRCRIIVTTTIVFTEHQAGSSSTSIGLGTVLFESATFASVWSLQCGCELVLAAQNGDETTITKLATFVNCFGSNGRSALHVISSEGCPEGAQILIHNGADVTALTARYKPPATNTPGCFGETLLHLAVRGGHRRTCAVLVEAGAPLEQFGDLGFQPLHVAALTEVVSPLNRNNAANSAYPLMFDDSIAQLLIHAGANPWSRSFNRDRALPFELANNGFAFDYS